MSMTPQLPSPGPQPMSDQHRAVLGTSIEGASVPMVGTPGAPIPSLLPALPFGPAHSAAQSLGGSGLGYTDGVVNGDTQIAHHTSWIAVLTLDFSGDPLTTIAYERVHGLLTGWEGVHMHGGRILVSAPTEGALHALLERVLDCLQVGDGGFCPGIRMSASTDSPPLSELFAQAPCTISQAALPRHCTAPAYSSSALPRSCITPARNACCTSYGQVHTGAVHTGGAEGACGCRSHLHFERHRTAQMDSNKDTLGHWALFPTPLATPQGTPGCTCTPHLHWDMGARG